MSLRNGKRVTALPGIHLKAKNAQSDAVINFDAVNTAPTTATGYYYLYVDSSGRLTYNNGTTTVLIGAAGAAATTWEALFANDSTFGISAGTFTITQSAAAAILTLNKTNVGAGAVIDITNSGTGADIANSTNYSLKATGGHGVLELGSTGSINVTDGALSIGKTGTATTLLGTLTVAEAVTFTSGGVTVTSGNLLMSSGNVTLTSGNFTVSSGVSTMISTSNAAPTLLMTNNTITTYGSGGTSTGMALFRSTSLTTGTLLRLQLTEATLNGGYYIDAWDVTAGAAVFSVAEDGVVLIAGTAGSNSLTLTAGDVVFSDASLAITDADNAATFTVTNNTATSASVIVLAGSGVFTGSTTTSWMTVTPSGLTTGTAVYLIGAALTTGKLLHMSATAQTDGILVDMIGGGANITATGRLMKLSMGAGTVGQALEVVTTGVYTGAGVITVTADSATTSGATVGQGIVAVSADALTTGTALDVTSTSIVLTSGRLADLSHISGSITGTLNKSGDLVSVVSTRTVTTGTVADDFDMGSFVRTSIINGAGSFSSTGSVVYVQNVVTNTSGTVTDSTNGVEIVMSANGTGDAISVTHSAVAGKGLNITSSATTAAGVVLVTANSLTSGQMMKLKSSATAIATTGRMFLMDHTGATGTSAVLAEFASAANDETTILKVTASAALAAGIAFDISAAALTTGKVIDMSDLDAITTGKAIHIDATGITQTSGILVHIDSASTALTSGGRLLLVDHTGNAGVSTIIAEVKSAATDETVIMQVLASAALAAGKAVNVSVASMTTGVALSIEDANALTTGSVAKFVSNSSDSSSRNLLFVHNDHASATGTVPLAVRQDAPTSTNYWKVQTFSNGSNTVTIWMGSGTTANGNLTGTAGDIIFNAGSNKPEYCIGTTNWTALV